VELLPEGQSTDEAVEAGRLRRLFQFFADTQCRGRSLVYETLSKGITRIHQHWPGPLALAEVGASAGLNLLFDRYRHRIGGQETASAAASPVLISCDLRFPAQLPQRWRPDRLPRPA
jgi:hypothetical protein